MANFFSTQVTQLMATPPTRQKANLLGGRMRFSFGQFTNPASGGAAIADVVYWTRVPKGGRVIGSLSRLNYATGAASCTMNVGDTVSATRYMTATSIATAGNTTLFLRDSSGQIPYEITDESRDLATGLPASTNDSDLKSVVAGADVAASQVIGLHVIYVAD